MKLGMELLLWLIQHIKELSKGSQTKKHNADQLNSGEAGEKAASHTATTRRTIHVSIPQNINSILKQLITSR